MGLAHGSTPLLPSIAVVAVCAASSGAARTIRFNHKLQKVDAQVALANEVLNHPEKNQVVFLPTGTGKTEIGLLISSYRIGSGDKKKVLVLVPNRRLGEQWVERAKKYGIDTQLRIVRDPAADEYVSHNVGNTERRKGGRTIANDLMNQRFRQLSAGLQEESQGRFDLAKSDAYDKADILVSTPDLMKNDLDLGRVGKKELAAFGTVVFDEVPDLDESGGGDTAEMLRRPESYRAILDLVDEAQLVGLTAFPGNKAKGLERILRARTIKPELSAIEKYLPIFSTIRVRVDDPLVQLLYDQIGVKLAIRRETLAKLLTKAGQPVTRDDLGVAQLAALARHKDPEIAKVAAQALELCHLRRWLLEAPTFSKEALKRIVRASEVSRQTIQSTIDDRLRHKRAPLGKFDVILAELLEHPGKTLLLTSDSTSAEATQAFLRGQGWRGGLLIGNQDQKKQGETLQKFNGGTLGLVVADYSSGGHGIDLHGGKRVIYVGLPRSRDQYLQGRGRVGRTGDISGGKQVREVIPFYGNTVEMQLQHQLTPVGYDEWPGQVVKLKDPSLVAPLFAK